MAVCIQYIPFFTGLCDGWTRRRCYGVGWNFQRAPSSLQNRKQSVSTGYDTSQRLSTCPIHSHRWRERSHRNRKQWSHSNSLRWNDGDDRSGTKFVEIIFHHIGPSFWNNQVKRFFLGFLTALVFWWRVIGQEKPQLEKWGTVLSGGSAMEN